MEVQFTTNKGKKGKGTVRQAKGVTTVTFDDNPKELFEFTGEDVPENTLTGSDLFIRLSRGNEGILSTAPNEASIAMVFKEFVRDEETKTIRTRALDPKPVDIPPERLSPEKREKWPNGMHWTEPARIVFNAVLESVDERYPGFTQAVQLDRLFEADKNGNIKIVGPKKYATILDTFLKGFELPEPLPFFPANVLDDVEHGLRQSNAAALVTFHNGYPKEFTPLGPGLDPRGTKIKRSMKTTTTRKTTKKTTKKKSK